MNLKTEAIIGIFIVTAISSFLYMSVQLGAFRFDTSKYAPYYALFKDVAGLAKKADVKIAGVKVGWVDDVVLEPDGKTVKAKLMILRDYTLYKNAYAIVRQEGMLGLKFLELVTGDPLEQPLNMGDTISYQARQFMSMDEILYSFAKVSQSVQELAVSLKDTAQEVRDIAAHLKGNIAPFADSVRDMKSQLSSSVDRVVTCFESTFDSIKKTTTHFDERIKRTDATLKDGAEVVRKLNQGQGVIGKLINEDEMYRDLKCSVKSVCNSLNRISQWSFAVDSYVEPLIGLDCPTKPRIKGYFDLYFYPIPSAFILGGVALSDKGFAKKTITTTIDCKTGKSKTSLKEKRTSVGVNFQVGKVFNDSFAVRLGLFESSVGFGIDWRIPLSQWQWITTFEAFDFRGNRRIGTDTRPHLKWLNRLFITPSLYLTFGAEDFISKHNKSGFVGAGVYFNDCDLKRLCY